jgi:hypothetical protein
MCYDRHMIYIDINEYIVRPRDERRAHLDLSVSCSLIGGYDSREYRGLLAHHLKTTIPTKTLVKICPCHACHQHGCSNVLHLYWGTARDNMQDLKESEKYLSEESINRRSEASRRSATTKRKTIPQ